MAEESGDVLLATHGDLVCSEHQLHFARVLSPSIAIELHTDESTQRPGYAMQYNITEPPNSGEYLLYCAICIISMHQF